MYILYVYLYIYILQLEHEFQNQIGKVNEIKIANVF